MDSYHSLIENASGMLDHTDGGGSTYAQHKLYSPTMSVFAGKEATAHKDEVFRRYRHRWDFEAGKAIEASIDLNQTTRTEDLQSVLNSALEASGYITASEVVQVLYWDISDDQVEETMRALNVPLEMPGYYSFYRIIYLFFRGYGPDIQTHICKITEWAKTQGARLVLLGNSTRGGMLSEERIYENYQLAADMTVLANSGSGGRRSSRFWFELRNAEDIVYSVSPYSVGKPSDEITRASFGYVLDRYKTLSANSHDSGMQNAVHNAFGGYCGILDQAFDEHVRSRFTPLNGEYLAYIPYSEATERFIKTGAKETRKFGLFRQKTAQDPISMDRMGVGVIQALGDMWSLIFKMYYMDPVMTWLDDNGGWHEIRQALTSILTEKIAVQQMDPGEVIREIEILQSKNQSDIDKEISGNVKISTLSEWLHSYAVREIKRLLYSQMYLALAEILRELVDSAGNFDNVIQQALRALDLGSVDNSIRSAYRALIEHNSNQFDGCIKSEIHPCNSVEELMGQVANVFRVIVVNTPEYKYTFSQELEWRMKAVGGTIDAVNDFRLADTEEYERSARLITREICDEESARVYTIISASSELLEEVRNDKNAGEIFEVPGSDRIDQLKVFPVKDLGAVYWS